jgi:hypothetical protein
MFTIKSQTDDPKSALAIVADQRNRGYTAWIEAENGKTVDEEALKTDKFIPTKPGLRERAKGLLFLCALLLWRSALCICLVCESITTERLVSTVYFGRLRSLIGKTHDDHSSRHCSGFRARKA